MLAQRLTLTAALSLALLAAGAQDSLLLRNYEFVKRGDPWLTSRNAAALTRFDLTDAATARLSLTRGEGGFTDFSGSPSTTETGAAVESFYRLGSRTVVFGSMSYGGFSGRRMGGSAFISPQRKPFDIVEDSLTNLGRKHRDTYVLSGAFGVDLWRGIALGARMHYTSANYAKYKDLRHKNKLMDMDVDAALYVPLGRAVQVGVAYTYRRTTESLVFSTYGTGDLNYVSLISYGPFMGVTELFGSAGLTERGREMPLVDDYDGLAVQLSLRPVRAVLLYQSLAYARRRGYYGRRSPYTVNFSRHHSRVYSYDAAVRWELPRTRLSLDAHVEAENLENKASVYRELVNESGASYYEYTTPVKTGNRLWVDGSLSATADLGLRRQQPAWTLRAGMDWNHRKQTAYLYPYLRRQRISGHELFASAAHHRQALGGLWSVQADFAFREGGGEPFEDDLLQPLSDKQAPPDVVDAYLWREYRWLTSPQYAVGATLRYAFVPRGSRMKSYVSISMRHRKDNGLQRDGDGLHDAGVGRDRTEATLAVGCDF